MPKRHPNKHIRQAVEFAVTQGWRLVKSSGHAWGILFFDLTDSGVIAGSQSGQRLEIRRHTPGE